MTLTLHYYLTHGVKQNPYNWIFFLFTVAVMFNETSYVTRYWENTVYIGCIDIFLHFIHTNVWFIHLCSLLGSQQGRRREVLLRSSYTSKEGSTSHQGKLVIWLLANIPITITLDHCLYVYLYTYHVWLWNPHFPFSVKVRRNMIQMCELLIIQKESLQELNKILFLVNIKLGQKTIYSISLFTVRRPVEGLFGGGGWLQEGKLHCNYFRLLHSV